MAEIRINDDLEQAIVKYGQNNAGTGAPMQQTHEPNAAPHGSFS
jgi:hypothetical protein